jgi:phosphotransferase system  glucose/maltose/N-acetylglucosamine-specific IIC component
MPYRKKGWTLPLLFAVAIVCQAVHVFTSKAGFLAGVVFGTLIVGLVVSLSDYLSTRGRESAAHGPGELFGDGEERK